MKNRFGKSHPFLASSHELLKIEQRLLYFPQCSSAMRLAITLITVTTFVLHLFLLFIVTQITTVSTAAQVSAF